MKVYRLNDHDYVAAESLEAAVEWLCEESGMDREDSLDPAYAPHEIPDEQMDRLRRAPDSDPDDWDTFRAALAEDLAEGRGDGGAFLFCVAEF